MRRERFTSRVEGEAAAWAARLDGGRVNPDDERRLAAWLSEDRNNGRCLALYRQFSKDIGVMLPAMVEAGAVEMYAPRRYGAWAAGLAAAAALAVGIGAWVAHRPPISITAAAAPQTIALEDGSRAELNAQTNLVVEMSGSARRVRLSDGEAVFSVAHDPARPFIVETPGGVVRDVGTVFNVRTDASGRLEVTVLEGSVRVEPRLAATAPVSLVAGQQLSVDAGGENRPARAAASASGRVRQLPASDVQDVVAWRHGGVVFEGVPLKTVLARFSRFHDLPMSASPEVANLRVGGRFSMEDLDGFLGALESALPVRVVRVSDGSVRVGPR